MVLAFSASAFALEVEKSHGFELLDKETKEPIRKADIKVPFNQVLVDAITGGKGKIVKSFQGPAGMVGLILSQPGFSDMIVWQTADGKHIIAGNLLDIKGRDLTRLSADKFKAYTPLDLALTSAVAQAAQQINSPDLSDINLLAQASLDLAKSGNGIIQGDLSNKELLIIYYDPDCMHCQNLHKRMHKKLDTTKTTIVLMPVASDVSLPKAIAHLNSGKVKVDLNTDIWVGGDDVKKAELTSKIEANAKTLISAKITTVPFVIKRSMDDQGMPFWEKVENPIDHIESLL